MQRRLIADIGQVNLFIKKYLPDLSGDEVYFLSLSARNKQLTQSEREQYKLSKTEMFARTLVRSKEKFIPHLRRFECDEEAWLTKNGKPIPEKCIICYVNINPSSALKATQEVMTEIQKRTFDSLLSAGKTPETLASLKKLDILVMNAFQKSRGTRHYLDIDFDIPKDKESLDTFSKCIDYFADRDMRFFTVETKGGFHVVVDKTTVKFNYVELLRTMETWFWKIVNEKIEVVQNKNEMIPVPGTLQAGFPVKVRENYTHWD